MAVKGSIPVLELPATAVPHTDISVCLKGMSAIMFDRFYGQEAATRPPEQKFYLTEDNLVYLPSENIYAFLLGERPGGCATFEGKKRKEYMRKGAASIIVKPDVIPFCRDGKPLHFNKFDGEIFGIFESAPRTLKGNLSIKQNVRPRPIIQVPWELSFAIMLLENDTIKPDKLENWFNDGGIVIGLGTYRPRFGRFSVVKFDYEE